MQFKPLFAALFLLSPASLFAQSPAPPPLQSHQLHPDRTVTFRFKDPAATKVELNLEGVAKPILMRKAPDGIWTYTTPPLAPEIYGYSFLDGDQQRIDPDNFAVAPNMAFPATNILVVPGNAPQPWDVTDVPHGTIHTHWLTTKIAQGLVNHQEQVVVYTPPGYDPHASTPYPTLYLLHGWSGLAEGWTHDQQANLILDNLLAEGKVKPMVVVMPQAYGDMSFVQNGFSIWRDPAAVEHNTQLFANMLTSEIMPFV